MAGQPFAGLLPGSVRDSHMGKLPLKIFCGGIAIRASLKISCIYI